MFAQTDSVIVVEGPKPAAVASVARNPAEAQAVHCLDRLIYAIEADCWKEMRRPYSREVPKELKDLLRDYDNSVNGFLAFEKTDPSTRFLLNGKALLERGILNVLVNTTPVAGRSGRQWSVVMIHNFTKVNIPAYGLDIHLYAFRSFCHRIVVHNTNAAEKLAARMLYYGIIHNLLLQEQEG